MALDPALLPTARKRHWAHSGLTDEQELIFHWTAVVVILLFIAAWVGAVVELSRERQETLAVAAATGVPVESVPASRHITSALFEPEAPKTAFINEAMLGFLDPLRGESGKLRFATVSPGQRITDGDPGDLSVVLSSDQGRNVSPDFIAPDQPGIYKLAVELRDATKAIDDLSVITLVPRASKRGGKIGLYYLGNWPYEGGGRPKGPRYAPPSGFIEVTPQNQNTYVSEHFRLRDFLTKDQRNVWPKYLLLDPLLIDKLELTIQELERRGVNVEHVSVMSGFRTPRYNHSGGNTAGRANLSRHMYGDAADIFVDNDRNGTMDDINRDGRVDVRDADLIGAAAERVERAHPRLLGGVGVYSACCGHGPFTHLDVRGFRARWRGTGNG